MNNHPQMIWASLLHSTSGVCKGHLSNQSVCKAASHNDFSWGHEGYIMFNNEDSSLVFINLIFMAS